MYVDRRSDVSRAAVADVRVHVRGRQAEDASPPRRSRVDGPLATAATLALAVVLIGSIACVRGALPSRSRDVYGPLAAGGDVGPTPEPLATATPTPTPESHADARSDTDADGGSHAGARCDARGDRYPRAGPDGHACADRDGRSDGHARPDVDSSTDRRQLRPRNRHRRHGRRS